MPKQKTITFQPSPAAAQRLEELKDENKTVTKIINRLIESGFLFPDLISDFLSNLGRPSALHRNRWRKV